MSQLGDNKIVSDFSGKWELGSNMPGVEQFFKSLNVGTHLDLISFDSTQIDSWDRSILAFYQRT